MPKDPPLEDPPLEDLSSAALIRAIEANLFALFQDVAAWDVTDAETTDELMRMLCDVPFPLFNSVLRARLDPDRADATIASVQAAARERGVPVLWWTGPSTRPTDLGARLVARGFARMATAPGMAMDLHELRPAPPTGGGVALQTVEDADALRAWSETMVAGFGMPAYLEETFAAFYAACGSLLGPPHVNVLATVDGRPAATASMLLGGGVAGLYNLATLPGARRRGIGHALTVAALQRARAHGYRVAILHASAMAVPLYERIGFRRYCEIDQYLWAPEG